MPPQRTPRTRAEWTPTRDANPTKDNPYLVCVRTLAGPHIQIAWFNPTFGWSLLPTAHVAAISHWAPLPNPPKGD